MTTDSAAPRPPRIYQHVTKLDDWGYSVLLHEDAFVRTFRFEDGAERSFRPDWWHKMEPVEVPSDRAFQVESRALEGLDAARRKGKGRKAPRKPDVTLEEQIALFREAYAVGFDDATWKAANIEKAQKRLEKYLSAEAIENASPADIHKGAGEVVEAFKSGVPKGDRERLHNLSDHLIEDFATALTRLLHGDADYARRFEAFASVLARGEADSWQLSTVFPALQRPEEELFVRPTAMRKQALILDIIPTKTSAPNARTYLELREAANAVRKRLIEEGEKPKNLFDIGRFTLRTLKAASEKGKQTEA